MIGGLALREAIVSERAVALLMEAYIEAHGADPRAPGTTEYHRNLLEARGGEAALRRLGAKHGLGEALGGAGGAGGVPGEAATERLALEKAMERWERSEGLRRTLPPGDPMRRALALLEERARRAGDPRGLPPEVAVARRLLLAHRGLDAEGLALWEEYEAACFEHGVEPEGWETPGAA